MHNSKAMTWTQVSHAESRTQGHSACLFHRVPLYQPPHWLLLSDSPGSFPRKDKAPKQAVMTLIIPSQRQGIWDHFLKTLAQQHWNPHPYHPWSQEINVQYFINMKGKKIPCGVLQSHFPELVKCQQRARLAAQFAWLYLIFVVFCRLQMPLPTLPELNKNISPWAS